MDPQTVDRNTWRLLLNDLVETATEGERGFCLASKDNREPQVAELLVQAQEACHAAATELRGQARVLGVEGQDDRAAKWHRYRGWIDFRAVPIARGTKSILEECERGEDYARSCYEVALKGGLPASARVVVERHYQRVIVIQDRLRILRNRFPASPIDGTGGITSTNDVSRVVSSMKSPWRGV